MKLSLLLACVAALISAASATEQPTVTYLDTPKPFRGAQTYKDKESGLLFYVESDGRHLAAIDSEGKIRWHRDPFKDAKLQPYRVAHPLIVEIGAPLDWMIAGRKGHFVRVNFDSSQTLIIDVSTGNPIWMGQD